MLAKLKQIQYISSAFFIVVAFVRAIASYRNVREAYEAPYQLSTMEFFLQK